MNAKPKPLSDMLASASAKADAETKRETAAEPPRGRTLGQEVLDALLVQVAIEAGRLIREAKHPGVEEVRFADALRKVGDWYVGMCAGSTVPMPMASAAEMAEDIAALRMRVIDLEAAEKVRRDTSLTITHPSGETKTVPLVATPVVMPAAPNLDRLVPRADANGASSP